MSREIRITISDDEVFERMKRVKKHLDLSWKEVLHRGLQIDDFSQPTDRDATVHDGPEQTPSPGDTDFGDRIERQLKQRIEASLENALGVETFEAESSGSPPYDYEDEVESLANAEDATLIFPFLDETPANRVPLRVEIEMRAGGVEIDVVAVRQSKSVTEMNCFKRATRQRIAEGLATGSSVRLELGDGAEEYEVTPVLTWGRDSQGELVVEQVKIEDVLFGEQAQQ
ncbi:hypothetical protein ACFQJ7_05440 [Halovenus rubra]|uniref:Uncharacterized protein n=2 Tax=Halovenus rubra TaxID=869890 RepID=A0ABD5X4M5_9EURY|nr:hypothetical protein [Halovenus rubra]